MDNNSVEGSGAVSVEDGSMANIKPFSLPLLFVGEKPSEKAIAMGVSWRDGRLAAKQLFDALKSSGIDPLNCLFANFFDPDLEKRFSERRMVLDHVQAGGIIVAMGHRVSHELAGEGIPHLFIYHPAARGAIRKKERYARHVKHVLKGKKP